MKIATVSQAKNRLSELLRAVRRGETVVILDRKTPVARIDPIAGTEGEEDERIVALVRAGLAGPPRGRLDVKRFLGMPRGKLKSGTGGAQAVVAEREETL